MGSPVASYRDFAHTPPVPPPSDREERPLRPPGDQQRSAARPVLHVVLGAEWVAASLARDRVRHWLEGLDWPPAQLDELVLAVSEAVSNSVEHGYGMGPGPPALEEAWQAGTVTVEGRTVPSGADGFRCVEFTVCDDGGWREPAAERGRGHGLLVMRACVDDLVVDGRASGTTVVLRSRPAPPAR